MEKEKRFFVYKYLLNQEVVYVGITCNLQNRCAQHEIEERFLIPSQEVSGFLEYDVYYFEVPSKSEAQIWELLLINKYKPVYNIKDKYSEPLSDPMLKALADNEPFWQPFDFKGRDHWDLFCHYHFSCSSKSFDKSLENWI